MSGRGRGEVFIYYREGLKSVTSEGASLNAERAIGSSSG